MNVQDIRLDIDKSPSVGEWVTIGQGDKAGTTIRATVYDHGTALPMSGMTARFCMRTPGGGYVEDEHVNVSGNTLTYVVDEEHCAGTVGTTDKCYFQILQGENVIASTSRFSMRVLRAASSGADPAQSYSDDIVAATRAARDAADAAAAAMEEIGTAVEDAAQAAESAAQAVQDAQTAVEDADTAKREATSAANAATAAANNANSKANAANTAANNANAATTATNSATRRAEAAIAAMGDISEQAVPLMSADTRGGAKMGDGLAVDDGTLHVGQLAKASTGEVYGPLASVTAKGHAEQVSTTGKNLLPNTATSQTVNGVTFTVNADGIVTANGTATANVYLNIVAQSSPFVLEAGTYTFSGGALPSGVQAFVNAVTNEVFAAIIGSDASTATLGETTQMFCYLKINSGANVNFTFYPQLELGSTATEYEPYSGGLPSPRPDWEQPIEVVRGRNLFDRDNPVVLNAYISNGVLVDHSNHRTLVIPCSANKTYVVSKTYTNAREDNRFVFGYTNVQPAAGTAVYGLQAWDGSGDTAYLGMRRHGRLTTGADAKFIVFWCSTSSGYNAALETTQVALGSTPMPYVPYGHVGLDMREKKLLDSADIEQGSIASSGVMSSSTRCRMKTAKRIPVTAGSAYVLTASIEGKTFNWYANWYANESTFDRVISDSWHESGYTVTAPSGASYVQFTFRASDDSDITPSDIVNPKLEFPPIATPIPLPQRGWVGSLPDGTPDVLSIDSAGKVEWELNSWLLAPSNFVNKEAGQSNNGNRFAALMPYKSKSNVNAYCNRAVPSASVFSNTYWKVGQFVSWVSNEKEMFIILDKDTIADANTWLASNPVTILYQLATPITEECGYVDLPDIPSEATVSIPELEDLGLTFWVDGDGTIRAAMREWYERAHSEYADRLTALEEAVAALVTQ